MAGNWPRAGISDVGEYQVSGRPFAKYGQAYANGWGGGAAITLFDDISNSAFIDFPFVTKRVIITNTGATTISIAFASLNLADADTATDSAVKTAKNYFLVAQNETFDMHVKVKRLFIAGKGGAASGVNIRAELTHIDDVYNLTAAAQSAADNNKGGLNGIAENVKKSS